MSKFLSHRRIGCLLLSMHLLACEKEPVDATPVGVTEEFIERMRGVHGSPERGRLALDLVWSEARAALEERAARATAAAGRSVLPEEMLVPSRFSLRFEPRRMTAATKGNWSRVTILGDNPSEIAEVHCVQEDGRWRVVLDLPPVAPIQRRE